MYYGLFIPPSRAEYFLKEYHASKNSKEYHSSKKGNINKKILKLMRNIFKIYDPVKNPNIFFIY